MGIMLNTICILGRQPELSLAELECVFGFDNLQPVSKEAALVSCDAKNIQLDKLGGTKKVGRIIGEINSTDWQNITKYLVSFLPNELNKLPVGKIRFGISLYGFTIKPSIINNTGLMIKKTMKLNDRTMRVIPNKTTSLNTAQTLHNKLTDQLGMELLIVKTGNKTIIAQTTIVQDITAYAARDQKRPKRDSRIGMLPPKLAQIIINLATKGIQQKKLTILDPFCGTGVILQESYLLGYNAIGTDINNKMIDYATQNLKWLTKMDTLKDINLFCADATKQKWPTFDTIACETYLGQPFSAEPQPEKLKQVIQDVNTIHKKFFMNIASQTKPNFRMCLAVPAWFTKNGVIHLPIIDQLTDIGYNWVNLDSVDNKNLIYRRENQFVGRQLIMLIRK